MTDESAIRISDGVMARQVAQETVILDLASGNYYGLNPVGARIWQLLAEGRRRAEICAVLLGEFEASQEQIEQDVDKLLDELRTRGLILID